MILVVAPYAYIVFRYIYKPFRGASLDIGRLSSAVRSPTFSLYSEALDGVVSIRAGDMRHSILNEFQGKLYDMLKVDIARVMASRWLAFRLQIASACMNTLSFCVLSFATVVPGIHSYMIVVLN